MAELKSKSSEQPEPPTSLRPGRGGFRPDAIVLLLQSLIADLGLLPSLPPTLAALLKGADDLLALIDSLQAKGEQKR